MAFEFSFFFFQAILASAFAKKDFDKATATASRVLQVRIAFAFAFAFDPIGTPISFSISFLLPHPSFLMFLSANGSTLQLGLVLGLVLSVLVAVVLQLASRLFTNDVNVRQILSLGIPVSLFLSPNYKISISLMETFIWN